MIGGEFSDVGDGRFQHQHLLPTADYDPDDETWAFLPGSKVTCGSERIGGEDVLVAHALAQILVAAGQS